MIRRRAILLAGIAIASSLALPLPASTATASLQPANLWVDGGEDAWHRTRGFGLHWSNPPQADGSPIAAIHYRLLDPSGQVAIAATRIDRPATSIEPLRVPEIPGAYTAEIWLENGDGIEGTPVTAKLRFDDVRPGAVDPYPSPGWIGRSSFPYTVRLGKPAGPNPVSGIRGYAVSVDRSPSGDPCASPDNCTETETDLHGGIDEDTLLVPSLPEGTNYVHAVAVSGSGMKSASVGHAVLRVDRTDPATRLVGVPAGWTNRPVVLTAKATDAASGMAAGGQAGPFTALQVDGAPPVTALGDTAGTTVIGTGIHRVSSYARDAAGNVAEVSFGEATVPPDGTATVRIDADPPTVAFTNSQDPSDPEAIEARMSDALSGTDLARGRIAVRRAGSGERFAILPTMVHRGALTAPWSSESYPLGEYEFQATAYDLAGNSASTTQRANGSRMVLRNPLKVSTTLLARLGRRDGAASLPYGHAASLNGRLIAGRRAPLANAPVRIVERFVAGGQRERTSTIRTDDRGAFAFRLAPGASREVVASFPGTPTLRSVSSQTLRLGVSGGVRMKASSRHASIGGPPVVFRGSIAGTIPPGGKLVQLQFRLPGLPWTEFRSFRTGPQGGFRYAYRFADDDSRGVSFQIRAFAPPQAGWPYEPAGSRPVSIRGR